MFIACEILASLVPFPASLLQNFWFASRTDKARVGLCTVRLIASRSSMARRSGFEVHERKSEGIVTHSSSDPVWWIFPKYNPVPFISLFKTFISHPCTPWVGYSLSYFLTLHLYQTMFQVHACLPRCISACCLLPASSCLSFSLCSKVPLKYLIIRKSLLDFFPADSIQLCRCEYTHL